MEVLDLAHLIARTFLQESLMEATEEMEGMSTSDLVAESQVYMT
jgi:hypothetical protein